MSTWKQQSREHLARIESLGQTRRVPDWDGSGHTITLPDGRRLLSFASSDYLGLSQHPRVASAAKDALERWGTGSGSARLIVGARPVHRWLEEAIAEWKDETNAVLFPAGYMANLGVISVFGGPGTTVFSDELNHASIIDACRLSRAGVVVYPHRDLDALERAVSKVKRAIVVSESVFSMDGDIADIEGLSSICERHGALLILDEAHAVLGSEPAPSRSVDRIRIGTLSKFLGSSGGFAAADEVFTNLIVNESRPFIFTTASPPADAAAALTALAILRSEEGNRLRSELRRRIDIIEPGHPSPIIPVVIGTSEEAVAASLELEKEGFLVPAIRPPTVAPGTARLRVTVSATHPVEEVERFAGCLNEIKERGAGA
ncbi:MAG: 8-amino-7-oxononanoate synthase [Actinobacteria bacterium]|nr:8-amino-7-oxononanoate synthase [Actinomycetota bacterium]